MSSSHSPLWQTIGISAITSAVVTSLVLVSLSPVLGGVQAVSQASSSQASAIVAHATGSVQDVVAKADPAVVSVVISKDVPVLERSYEEGPFGWQIPSVRQRGTEKREIGGGTAFFIREDGLLMTNKHVVSDPEAEYTVFLNDGRERTAKVAARDPGNDIALLKVEGSGFSALPIALDGEPRLGQQVVAIGNALAEFRNTVSVGVVSGLGRSIVAGDIYGGATEQLSSIIQTDAAINQGNSGGPLLDMAGNVIGMNTAVAGGAQNIAFAIPAADLRKAVTSYERDGRITRAYIGIRYVPVTKELQEQRKLAQDYGVLIGSENTVAEPSVLSGSPAEKAGLRDGDVILKIDNEKITTSNPLASVIGRRLPGDKVTLTVLSGGQEKTVTVTLEEWRDE